MSGKGRGKEAVLPAWMTNPALYGKDIPSNGGNREIKYARQVYIKDSSSDEKIHKSLKDSPHHHDNSPPPISYVKLPLKTDNMSSSKRYRSPTPPRNYKRRETQEERNMYADADSVDSREERRYRRRSYEDDRRH